MLSWVNKSGLATLKRLDTETTQSITLNVGSTTTRLGLGCRARSVIDAFVDSDTFAFCAFYNRALSQAEINRAYRWVKARMAAKNVTVL
jgi:hypothetical protein